MSFGLSIPGVPQLPLGAATAPIVGIASSAISSMLWQAAQQPPQWGVFDQDNNLAVQPDSILDFTHRTRSEIANFPIQDGSFASYNKVVLPFEIILRFTKGGSQDDRTQFLADIETLYQSIDLYTVMTPERVYEDVNLEYYEIVRRGSKGAYWFAEVDLYFQQILQTQAQYTNTSTTGSGNIADTEIEAFLPNSQSTSAQPTSNIGSVQPQTPTSQQSQDGSAALDSVPDPELF